MVDDEQVEMQEIKIILQLHAPVEMDLPTNDDGELLLSREQSIEDYISHWLEEGYYVKDHLVDLPHGIVYKGFDIDFGETFEEEPE